MRRTLCSAACALGVLAAIPCLPRPLAAQFAVEGRIGAAIGSHEPAAAGLQTTPGVALAVSVEYAALPRVSLYAGYTRAAFECRDGFCAGRTVQVASDGVAAGLVARPVGPLRVRAGVVYGGVDAGGATGDAGLGLDAGAGLALDLPGRWGLPGRLVLRPELGFRRQRTTTGGVEGVTTMIVGSVGVAVRVGG